MLSLRFRSNCLYVFLWILPVGGSGLVALGAFLGNSRYREFLYGAFGLTVCGWYHALLVVVSALADSGSIGWWAFVAYAYTVGAIMSLVGAGLVLVESFRKPLVTKDNVEAT